MSTMLTGYPFQHEMNVARINAWNDSYKKETYGACCAKALVHKELTLVTAVTNVAAMGISTVGFVLGAALLGTPKLAVFIFTAGSVRPTYSTGCLYNGEVFCSSIGQILRNTGELIYDGGFIVYKCGKGIHWTAKQLHLDGNLKRIAKATFELIGQGLERVAQGTGRAVKHEPSIPEGSPFITAWINEPTKNCRIDFSSAERSVLEIVAHTALSVGNVPVNVLVGCGSALVAVPLIVGFTGKVGINSITNLDIPGPTFAGTACVVAGKSLYNALADVGTLGADAGVLVYKTANIFRLNRLMAGAIEFLAWSVGAIFS